MSDLNLPDQISHFQALLSDTSWRDTRAERIICDQVSKLQTVCLSTSARPPFFNASDATRHARLQKMINARRRQVERWSDVINEAHILAPRLDMAGDRLRARDIRQTMFVYQGRLEDAQEDLETRMRLLKMVQGLKMETESNVEGNHVG